MSLEETESRLFAREDPKGFLDRHRGPAIFEGFLKLTAGRIGQLLNDSSLADDCGIAVDTARRWLPVLRTSFVILLVQPHHRNGNKRLIRSPKLYFCDTGLACYLLGIGDAQQLKAHPLGGTLFEGYVVAEAAMAYLHHRRTPPLYLWRDRTGRVEIKSGATMSENLSAPLRWWCAQADRALDSAALIQRGSDGHTRSGVAVRLWYCV